MFEQFATTTPVVSMIIQIKAKRILDDSVKEACNRRIRGSLCLMQHSKLIQAFVHVLVTCKNEDDRIKNEGARVFTRFLPL